MSGRREPVSRCGGGLIRVRGEDGTNVTAIERLRAGALRPPEGFGTGARAFRAPRRQTPAMGAWRVQGRSSSSRRATERSNGSDPGGPTS